MNEGRNNRDISLVRIYIPQPRYVLGRTFYADFSPRRERAMFWGCPQAPRKLTDAQPVVNVISKRARTILSCNDL